MLGSKVDRPRHEASADTRRTQQHRQAVSDDIYTALTHQIQNVTDAPIHKARLRIPLDLGIHILDSISHKLHSVYITEGTRLHQLLQVPLNQHTDAPWINNYLGVHLRECRDKRQFELELPRALEQLRSWSIGEIEGHDDEGLGLIVCLGQLLTWLCHSNGTDHTSFAYAIFTSLDDSVSMALSWSHRERTFSIQPGPRFLWLLWAAVELSFRLSCVHGQLHKDIRDKTVGYIDQLLNALLEAGFSGVEEDLNAARAGHPITNDIIDIWVCVIHVSQSVKIEQSEGLSLWSRIEVIFKNAERLPRSPLERSESIWMAVFTITALSQFTDRGTVDEHPLLSSHWPLVSLAVSSINLHAGDDAKYSSRVLRKRDLFIRGLLARCLILNIQWGWKLTASVELLNDLCEIFRSRQFSRLHGESLRLPLFLTETEGFHLVEHFDVHDSGHDLFLKLIIRADHDLRAHSTSEVPQKQTKKLLSMMLPVSTAQFTENKPPSGRDLSKLYNRYASVMVAAHLDFANFRSRTQQAQRYSDFRVADWKSRHANIRVMTLFGLAAMTNGLPMEDVLLWQSTICTFLLSEVRELEAHMTDVKIPRLKFHQERLALCVQMALGSVRFVYERMSEPGWKPKMPALPNPSMLQTGVCSNLASLC